MSSDPTIVLVHGAFADASSWAPVTRRLLDLGYSVLVPAVPNRGLDSDAAYVRSIVEQIDGRALLVGHSYGGAVITVAGEAENVVGLVYVSAYALDVGESVGQLQAAFPDPELAAHLVYAHFPNGSTEPGMDVSVDIDAFPRVLAVGVPNDVAEVLAVSQRPLAAVAFGDVATGAAWRTRPVWGVVSSKDRSINPELQRFAYSRAGASRVIEVDAPHLVMQTSPGEVVALVAEAVESIG